MPTADGIGVIINGVGNGDVKLFANAILGQRSKWAVKLKGVITVMK